MKVATIQFAPTQGDKQASLRVLAGLVLEAVHNEAELIVMPELAAVGYSFMNEPQAAEVAEVLTEATSDPKTSMGMMTALATKYRVHLVWGLVEKDPGTKKLYNSQVLVCPDGTFESVRKINLWGNDFLWASEGRSNPPVVRCNFDSGEKKVGLLICRDVRDKKDEDTWTSFYEKGDADIVAFSANWGDGGFPAVAWMDFVKDNKVTLVVSNRYGKEVPNDFGEGGICIIEPSGKVHCDGLQWNQNCIVFADLP